MCLRIMWLKKERVKMPRKQEGNRNYWLIYVTQEVDEMVWHESSTEEQDLISG